MKGLIMKHKEGKPTEIYKRLKNDLGLSKVYLKNTILPEWWDDEILKSESGFQNFYFIIAQNVGIPYSELSGNKKLRYLAQPGIKYKKLKSQDSTKFNLSIQIAQSLGEKALMKLGHPKKDLPNEASDVRSNFDYNPLKIESVLNYFNDLSIPIIPVWSLPKNYSKPTAMVFSLNGGYVIALGVKQSSPSLQIFHLLHELGHVSKGHLNEKNSSIIDVSISKDIEDEIETEANRFAVEAITLEPNFETQLYRSKNANEFAKRCKEESEIRNVDPAFLATNYAWSNSNDRNFNYWSFVNSALKNLEEQNALEAIQKNFLSYFPEDEVHKDFYKYINKIAQV